jgi:SAM-dependent methyltransferase
MWVPVFECWCGGPMSGDSVTPIVCPNCGARIEQERGIFRCLDPVRRARLEPFLAQYRVVRQQDGYRVDRPEYYRSLPRTMSQDAQAAIWRIRRRTFQRLCHEVAAGGGRGRPTVLDLGAGSGWLCHRLARLGCRPVAVDLLADDEDGLGARHYYDARFACVQADFDCLPLAPHQFDVVIFNGSLHYAPDVEATLERAERMLARGGRLIVADSPTFVHDADGLAMRARQRERLRREYGVESPVEPGEGFLLLSRLDGCAAAMGRSTRFFETPDGWRARLRRLAAPPRPGAPRGPRFGVWIAA